MLTEVPTPTLQAHKVLVSVHACGVCHFDAINREGAFPRTVFPAILGHEIAGEIAEVGVGVTHFVPGDRVVATQVQPCGGCRSCRTGNESICREGAGVIGQHTPGGYAELVPVDHRALVLLPDDVAMTSGSILACAVGTALHAVRARADVRAGERVLITGASGGVGVHAVQLVRLAGARVIAVTSSPAKADELDAIGAHDVIVAPDLDFAGQVKKLTDGDGVDAVIEIVGAATFQSSLRSLAPRGRLVFVGNVTARDVALTPVIAIMKEIVVTGSQACTRQELADVIELVRRGDITPMIDRTLPLHDAAEAHRLLDGRHVQGRVVLVP